MNMWDERYSANDTVYEVQPNVFFASQLAMRELGTVCLPCDGEGRNAVHAAAKGWTVRSFDVSPVGVQRPKPSQRHAASTFRSRWPTRLCLRLRRSSTWWGSCLHTCRRNVVQHSTRAFGNG